MLAVSATYAGEGWVLYASDYSPIAYRCSQAGKQEELNESLGAKLCEAKEIRFEGTVCEVLIPRKFYSPTQYVYQVSNTVSIHTQRFYAQYYDRRVYCPACYQRFVNSGAGRAPDVSIWRCELGETQG